MKTLIMRSGSIFNILDHSDDYYLAEQRIENKIVAYEVSKINKTINRYNNNEIVWSICRESIFGKGDVDRSFPARSREEAFDYFRSLNKYKKK